MNTCERSGRFILLLITLVFGQALAGDYNESESSRDGDTLSTARQGLQSVVRYLRERPALLSPDENNLPDREKRQQIRAAWQHFLDHLIALDTLGRQQDELYHTASGPGKECAFQLGVAAFLTQYRYALEFLALVEQNPKLHAVLNEPVPELGMPEGSYAAAKFRFLNVIRAAEFSRLLAVYRTGSEQEGLLDDFIEQDSRYIVSVNRHGGPALTLRNAARIVQDTAFTAWFPVQKEVSEWMGDTRVWRSEQKNLVAEPQLEALQPRLRPGDILLVRREWYLSNIGLPGFWPHAALYIGTPEERRDYFADQATKAWVAQQGESSGELENLLERREPDAYTLSLSREAEHPLRVLEAISEGVSFTTLEHAAGGDSVAVIRPRVKKQVKARAIVRALHYAGRPYDFDFNFLTDSALVCTELVYKAYEPSVNGAGLKLPVENVLGRPVMPANRLARLFDAEYGSERQQFDFVAFLDGNEKAGRAVLRGVDAFRASWRRPKWHILVQGTRLSKESR